MTKLGKNSVKELKLQKNKTQVKAKHFTWKPDSKVNTHERVEIKNERHKM